MIRSTLLALAATAGLIGVPESGTSNAHAGTVIRFGIYAPAAYPHRHYRPIIVAPVITAPVVYAPTAPVYVTPVCTSYEVLVRGSPVVPWQLYATYPSYPAAQAAVPGLQASGLWVMVEQR